MIGVAASQMEQGDGDSTQVQVHRSVLHQLRGLGDFGVVAHRGSHFRLGLRGLRPVAVPVFADAGGAPRGGPDVLDAVGQQQGVAEVVVKVRMGVHRGQRQVGQRPDGVVYLLCHPGPGTGIDEERTLVADHQSRVHGEGVVGADPDPGGHLLPAQLARHVLLRCLCHVSFSLSPACSNLSRAEIFGMYYRSARTRAGFSTASAT